MLDKLIQQGLRIGLAAVGAAPTIHQVTAHFDWARSVVVAGLSYLPPERPVEDDAARGMVARFARGADYHTVLTAKLEVLADAVRSSRPDSKAVVCVDTCPLPERKLAVLGGIGWRGRNCSVFIDGHGSYVVLGEIVTDLELPVSGPAQTDRCGDCDRCVRACPTGAIAAPGVLDRSRCLSWITQAPGTIPPEHREKLGSRIYGCDACQEVCPHNAGLQPTTPEFAEPQFPGARPEIVPLINISAREFRRTVRPSSIGWIGRTRVRRNAAIAAGNLRCREAADELEIMISDDDPILRDCAGWALRRME